MCSIFEAICVQLDGCSTTWHVRKDCVKDTDHGKFILLDAMSPSLRKLVIEKNENVPRPCPRNVITSNPAFQEIIAKRNKAQVDDLSAAGDTGCSLFGETEATPKKVKRRRPQRVVHTNESITFEVDSPGGPYQVTAMRPLTKRSHPYILADEGMVEAVLKHMRSVEYTDNRDGNIGPYISGINKNRNPTLQRGCGIWQFRNGFRVGAKTFKTIEEAQAAVAGVDGLDAAEGVAIDDEAEGEMADNDSIVDNGEGGTP